MCLKRVIKIEDMTNKMQVNWDIIARRILGKCTGDENARVERWLAEDEKNREYYRKAKRYFDLYYTGEAIRAIDVESAWEEFVDYTRKPSRRGRWKKVLRYAAILLLPVCAGLAYWLLPETMKEPVAVMTSTVIKPGTTRAMLVLNSGERAMLSDSSVLEKVVAELKKTTDDQPGTPAAEDAGEVIYNQVIVPRGGEYCLTLPDGTLVRINAESKLSIPVRFPDGERRVRLEGEALFSVTKDAGRPFVVETAVGEVNVLGTLFNLNAYPDEGVVRTTLVEGKVSFRGGGMTEAKIMRPGEQMTYDKGTGEARVARVNPGLYTAWAEGKWIIEGQRLEEIMKQLSRWYDVTVFYQNAETKDLVFTGDLEKYTECGVILDIIAMTTNVEFIVKDRVITVKTR